MCGKNLERCCPVCGVMYEKTAKFCMSCGGKLEDLVPSASMVQEFPPEQNGGLEIEFDESPDSETSDPVESIVKDDSNSESFVEIDFGIGAASEDENANAGGKLQLSEGNSFESPDKPAENSENAGEKLQFADENNFDNPDKPVKNSENAGGKLQLAGEKRKPYTTIEIKIDEDEHAQKDSEPKLNLQFENQVLEQKKKQKERSSRNTLKAIESEKASGDFITKWGGAKEVVKKSAKKPKATSEELNFDELFSELTSITKDVPQNEMAGQAAPQQEVKFAEVPKNAEISSELQLNEPKEFDLEIESVAEPENKPEVQIQVVPETVLIIDDSEIETAENQDATVEVVVAAAAAANTISVHEAPVFELKPYYVNETYDVSFDKLISETVSSEFEESCVPMLRKIEQNMRVCKGGAFFLRGESGIGKSRLFVKMKEYAEKYGNSDSETFNIVVSDANIFDFDFMIFINLIKKLMKITSNDPSEIAEKFNSIFGEALPDNKKECLNALISLNFVPLKAKLPKHDIEYLIAYVIYSLSRNKPVLWFINNANSLNMRTVKFLANLKSLFDSAPIAVICAVDENATVLADAVLENIYDFRGFDGERLTNAIFATLGTKRIPAEMEKLLREKAGGNMLFAMQLAEYLKDLGLIFEMKGSWRFAKLPDDFKCPAGIDELIAKRILMLSDDLFLTLKEFTLLNLYSVPRNFFSLVSTTGSECVEELIKKGYLVSEGDSISFAARAIMSVLKKAIKIGKQERAFYRNTVNKLISTDSEIPSIDKHWLLLSYINLGGIIDKQMNSFLFSSAVYMEKLGFFEISQRSYQTIISSFEADDAEDDFRILPEIKNARLWKIIDPQWAKIFWEKLLTYAKQHFDYHLEMLAKSEILLLDEKDINLQAVADIIKKFHTAGCYEDEFRLIDKTTDILIANSEHLEANTFAVRGYKLLRDVIAKSDGKGMRPAEFIYILYIRSACKLAEICITLKNYSQATEILEEVLNYAEKFRISYFKSKIMFLLGKIRKINGGDWEELIKEGFSNALIVMDFSILKGFLHFFEENGLENRDWVEPFLEYKNCMNF